MTRRGQRQQRRPPAGPFAARYLRRPPYPRRQPRSRSSAHGRRAAIKEGYDTTVLARQIAAEPEEYAHVL